MTFTPEMTIWKRMCLYCPTKHICVYLHKSEQQRSDNLFYAVHSMNFLRLSELLPWTLYRPASPIYSPKTRISQVGPKAAISHHCSRMWPTRMARHLCTGPMRHSATNSKQLIYGSAHRRATRPCTGITMRICLRSSVEQKYLLCIHRARHTFCAMVCVPRLQCTFH